MPVWWLVHPREMKDLTDGGYLELVNEFEVAVGGEVFPHTHPTHEFYFVMSGRGVMTVADEERDVAPGDLVYIPPDTMHSLRPTGDGADPLLLLRGRRSRARPRSTTRNH